MIDLTSHLFFTEEKNAINKFIEANPEVYDYLKEKIIKKHFDKNLIMSEEDKKIFQSSNKCWICNKLFVADDNKVRDHDHVTGKYKGSAHSSFNSNLKLTKKIPVILHNLRGYYSH